MSSSRHERISHFKKANNVNIESKFATSEGLEVHRKSSYRSYDIILYHIILYYIILYYVMLYYIILLAHYDYALLFPLRL